MHRHGGDIYSTSYRIDFSANLNPLGMPESVQRAACEGVRLSVNYPDVQCRRLRQAIAQKENVSVEHVICGNGAAELIFSLALALRPGQALLTVPGFAEYEQALEGCRILCYPLKKERGFALTEDYLEKLDESLDVVFLCNPNNPTGGRIPRPLLERIVEKCESRGIYLVLDVCFMDFLDHPEETDFSAAIASHPHLFLLKAFTKTYAMAGLRLGYGLCSDEGLLSRMRRMRQPWNVSVPAQMAGEAALKETRYVEEARGLIGRERAWLFGKLQKLGLTVYEPSANFIFFEGPKGLAKQCGERGILIRDCANYRGLLDGYYRVAVRTHAENEELVRVLKESMAWRK